MINAESSWTTRRNDLNQRIKRATKELKENEALDFDILADIVTDHLKHIITLHDPSELLPDSWTMDWCFIAFKDYCFLKPHMTIKTFRNMNDHYDRWQRTVYKSILWKMLMKMEEKAHREKETLRRKIAKLKATTRQEDSPTLTRLEDAIATEKVNALERYDKRQNGRQEEEHRQQERKIGKLRATAKPYVPRKEINKPTKISAMKFGKRLNQSSTTDSKSIRDEVEKVLNLKQFIPKDTQMKLTEYGRKSKITHLCLSFRSRTSAERFMRAKQRSYREGRGNKDARDWSFRWWRQPSARTKRRRIARTANTHPTAATRSGSLPSFRRTAAKPRKRDHYHQSTPTPANDPAITTNSKEVPTSTKKKKLARPRTGPVPGGLLANLGNNPSPTSSSSSSPEKGGTSSSSSGKRKTKDAGSKKKGHKGRKTSSSSRPRNGSKKSSTHRA